MKHRVLTKNTIIIVKHCDPGQQWNQAYLIQNLHVTCYPFQVIVPLTYTCSNLIGLLPQHWSQNTDGKNNWAWYANEVHWKVQFRKGHVRCINVTWPKVFGPIVIFLKFLLSLNSQKRLGYKENNIKYKLTLYWISLYWKPRSPVGTLLYRTWPVRC